MGSWRSIPCRNAYRPPNAVYAGCLEALRVALQRDGAPVSITQIMPRTINTRCPTTLAPRWRRSVPKNSDLGIGRPPRGQPGVGVGAPLAAVLTAWLHHLTATAHDGRLIGHGIGASPAMINTFVAAPRRSQPT